MSGGEGSSLGSQENFDLSHLVSKGIGVYHPVGLKGSLLPVGLELQALWFDYTP